MKTKDFINKATKVHSNRYDYKKVTIKTPSDKVKIICKVHGEFTQLASSHLKGFGCFKCGVKTRNRRRVRNMLENKNQGLRQPKEYKLIPLTLDTFAKVDNEDYEKVKNIVWYAHPSVRTTYARSGIHGFLHNFILGATPGSVDHINHDGLDNRRCNLRFCTPAENSLNRRKAKGKTSKYLGVFFEKRRKAWVAKIRLDNKTKYLGQFSSEEEAALAYNKEAKVLFGKFAEINKI